MRDGIIGHKIKFELWECGFDCYSLKFDKRK